MSTISKIDTAKATPNLLEASSRMNDIDDAVKAIQDACGITSGDVAGIFFSDHEWESLSHAERVKLLRTYLEFEISFAGLAPSTNPATSPEAIQRTYKKGEMPEKPSLTAKLKGDAGIYPVLGFNWLDRTVLINRTLELVWMDMDKITLKDADPE